MDPAAKSCRRCNQPFDREQRDTFHTLGPWTRAHRWAPGLIVSVMLGYLGFHLADEHATRGWPVFIALPSAIGLTMGLTMPMSVALGFLLVPLALLLLGGVLMTTDLSGPFCALTLYVMFLPFTFGGMVVGYYLRIGRLRSRVARGVALLLVAAVPLVAAEAIDRWGPPTEVVVVRTERVVAAPADEVWMHLQFYEEVRAEPPLLLRFGLPIPLRAEGSKANVGETQVCVYERGKGITKRITDRREARLLAFEVIEQRLGFEHDLTLLGGAFELEPTRDGGTRLRLVTRYRARSFPGWAWRPLEAHVLHTLHDHIAGEIERRATRDRAPLRAEREHERR